MAAVWQALRDPEQIRNWHGWDYDGLDEHSLLTSPHGNTVVSSYGLDADAFGRLSARITG